MFCNTATRHSPRIGAYRKLLLGQTQFPHLRAQPSQFHTTTFSPRAYLQRLRHGRINQQRRPLKTETGAQKNTIMSNNGFLTGTTTVIVAGALFYILYEQDLIQPLPPTKSRERLRAERLRRQKKDAREEAHANANKEALAELPQAQVAPPSQDEDASAWSSFSSSFEAFTSIKDVAWEDIQEELVDFLIPDWAKTLPENFEKLQRELSMAPGSLADEIWKDALDPESNPEVARRANVRISHDLCDEEKEFLEKRRKFTTTALAKYLGIPEEEIHPDDVPTIALVSSGGGLRALVAGTGSLQATAEAGLFDCITYTAGVSGSCWLQALYHSSLAKRDFSKLVEHLKQRLGTHIAYPPAALELLNSAPTNKFLLSGFVEKLKADPNADFGIVDIYGLLLAARLLVPGNELILDNRDLKISNQRLSLQGGKQPMPIYTAVRHEIPILEEASAEEKATDHPSEETKEKARREAWFQWFEISPYEMFCEEFSAGIPTWAMGRKFVDGRDLPIQPRGDEDGVQGLRPPELKLPLLLGVFGSAMCATLSHYAREVKPVVQGLLPVGFHAIQEMLDERNDDFSKVHPINPASIPNFCLGLEGQLPETAPESILRASHLQLMDAGMSNNLPIYSCLRPGRDVDILIAFDASADIKTENWLQVTEGYALQRGIKGWPIGAGWPKPRANVEQTAKELEEAETASLIEAEEKVAKAKKEYEKDITQRAEQAGVEAAMPDHEKLPVLTESSIPDEEAGDLGYCNVWVGTTQERAHDDSRTEPKSKLGSAVEEDWQLMEPDAGIAVVYFPFLANKKVQYGEIDPQTSAFMSTWNFVYTPEEVENTVALARVNFEEGKEKTRRVVRAVYERRKKMREERENKEKVEEFTRKLRLGVIGRKEGDGGQGDHFR